MPSDLDPPRIGISRCLLGDEVRYDGGHKREDTLVSELGRHVEWVPVCPEMEVGMGVPREPIQLVASVDGVRSESARVRMVGVLSGEDWTARMEQWARARVHAFAALRVSGFVLKARSPSCGPHDVPVHGHGNDAHTLRGRGLFAEALDEGLPGLPIEDEEGLRDPDARQRFLDRVLAYQTERR
ncbi:MAG TPA: DUF523 domain-containing protein [Vicinamibacterales bacterium]|nr:DUF523 domain-containing protein [Vicinamibacterales bacterium]